MSSDPVANAPPSSQPTSVSQLLAAAKTGAPERRDELFQACRPYLRLLAQAQVQDALRAKVDASDLVQETLLEAYRDFDRFQGASEAEWLAWLKRILRHNLGDFLRRYRGTAKRQVAREVAIAKGGDSDAPRGVAEPAAAIDSPSRQLMRKDCQALVAAALEQLAPDHREVIQLRNLERLPFDEVARRMGRSRPAVQMLWMRAIRKMEQLALAAREAAPE